MDITIAENAFELGIAAGAVAASLIREAIKTNGSANIIMATGTSQFETINQLLKEALDWSKVTMFHLDEYIGLPEDHPASFRRYLRERFLSKLPPLKAVHLINGDMENKNECERLGELIKKFPIDVALIGIGENGHLAFNDPPADFDTSESYITVALDEACRKQQLGEGWFASLDEVPGKAISMSVKQIILSKHLVCSVPDSRKALAVRDCIRQAVDNQYPASILQTHPSCHYFLDKFSAALL